jgi:hypothetical protein
MSLAAARKPSTGACQVCKRTCSDHESIGDLLGLARRLVRADHTALDRHRAAQSACGNACAMKQRSSASWYVHVGQ